MFDLNTLFIFCQQQINAFASQHKNEQFYAFAIDGNLLCLNTVAAYQQTLAYYQGEWPDDYGTQEAMDWVKYNPGDWMYQGFASLEAGAGFNQQQYEAFYYMAEADRARSPYAQAMRTLVDMLTATNSFMALNTTPDFAAFWVNPE